MAKSSDEGTRTGLGWVDGHVRQLPTDRLASKPYLPHMGWNSIQPIKDLPILNQVDATTGFYFLHSYCFDCADPESVPDEFRLCCDDAVPDVIQERAVTSPIFYRPEGVAKLKGRVRYGPVRDANVLKLNATLGAIPADFDPNQNDLTIRVSDDDEVYAVTIPAGTMRQSGSNGFVYRDPSGSLAGLDKATVKFTRGGQLRLRLRTVPMALAAMDRTDHMVDIEIRIGNYAARHSRRWASRLNRVFTPS